MGIVARQSIKNFLWSNVGILLGALYTFLIIPRVFDENPAQWGLIQLIIYYSQILIPITLLSVPGVIIRYFPSFKKEGRANDLYSISIAIVAVFALLVAILFAVFRGYLISNKDGVEHLSRYILIVIPVFILSSFYEIFAAWSKVNLKSTLPNFLKDSFLKIWNFIIILLFYFHLITFNTLLALYFSIYLFQASLMLIYIKRFDGPGLRLNRSVIRATLKKEHFSYMIFGVMGSASFALMNKVDMIMIGKMLSLQEVAFYSIGLAFVAFIQLPEKSISAISVPTLSHLLAKEDHKGILTLYRKTSINQVVLSGYIFLGVWINIHNIAAYLGPKFGNIEYVVLFLGLAKIVDVFTGLNGTLIGISKYYRASLVMQLILLVLMVGTNLVFIPRYGFNGAAFASFISLSLHNIIKTVFVYVKYRIWPFSFKSMLAILIGLSALFLNRFIPDFEGFLADVLIRSSIFSLFYISLVLGLRISGDLNDLAGSMIPGRDKKRKPNS